MDEMAKVDEIARLNAQISDLRRQISSDPSQMGRNNQLHAQIADLMERIERLQKRT